MNAKTLMGLGGIGLIVGAAMPWGVATSIFGQMTMSGLEGDGIFTAAAGVVLLIIALAVKGKPGKSFSVVGGIIAILAGVMLVNILINLGGISSEPGIVLNVGTGLYISIIGAVLGAIGGFVKSAETEELNSSESSEGQDE